MIKTIWALMDNRRGSVGQAKGVLNALKELAPTQYTIIEKELVYNQFAGLPNWIRGKTLLGITAKSKAQIKAPYPDLVLSISRRTVPVARYIKKKSPSTKLVQLMHSGRTGINDFSLLIVPEHDKNKKTSPNVHYIVGCPHQVTAKYLAEAKEKWMKEFADLPKPLTAVIVGGAIKGKPFPEENVKDFCQKIKALKEKIGGSILITTSRRTGAAAEKIIKEELKDLPQYNYYWGDTRENPYAGFLACADNVVITADSVSMCCEASGTGRPLYLYMGGAEWMTPKHFRFAQSLIDGGYAVLLNDFENKEFKPNKGLNAAEEVAELINSL
jgi:mitochondrial fission protein ELM1